MENHMIADELWREWVHLPQFSFHPWFESFCPPAEEQIVSLLMKPLWTWRSQACLSDCVCFFWVGVNNLCVFQRVCAGNGELSFRERKGMSDKLLFIFFFLAYTAWSSIYITFNRITSQLVLYQYCNQLRNTVFSCLVSHNQLSKSSSIMLRTLMIANELQTERRIGILSSVSGKDMVLYWNLQYKPFIERKLQFILDFYNCIFLLQCWKVDFNGYYFFMMSKKQEKGWKIKNKLDLIE